VRDGLTALVGKKEKNAGLMFAAGFMCGSLGFWLSTPLFQMKTRLQAEAGTPNPVYKNGFNGLVKVYTEEGGVRGLFRGAMPLVLRGALLAAGSQLGYDGVKTVAKENGVADAPTLHVCASTVAAFLATTFSSPADILMTNYQTARQRGLNYNGVLHCASTMLKEHGVAVFFKGWSVQFARIAPVFAFNMPLYEQFRKLAGLTYMN
jgi:hypothetical protein